MTSLLISGAWYRPDRLRPYARRSPAVPCLRRGFVQGAGGCPGSGYSSHGHLASRLDRSVLTSVKSLSLKPPMAYRFGCVRSSMDGA